MIKKLARCWIGLLLSGLAGLLLMACSDSLPPTSTLVAGAQAGPTPQIAPAGKDTIRLYFSLPLSSDPALFTTYIQAGEMALDDATGGTRLINGRKVELVALDDADPTRKIWDEGRERANAQRAAQDPAALVYIGPVNSGAASISIPILNQAGLAMVSPGATYPGLTRVMNGVTRVSEPDDYYPTKIRNFFRVVTPDDVQTFALADFFKSLGATKIFLLDDSQLYGRGLADALARQCSLYKLDCDHRSSITGNETSYQALAEGIKQVAPDLIFFGGITQQQAPQLVQAIRAAGITAPFMGGGAMRYDLFIQEAGPASEGVYGINAGTTEETAPPKGQDFLQRYRAKYSSTGLNQSFTRQAYEAVSVALYAIKQAGAKDRQSVIRALAAVRNFGGVLGKWSFDANGDFSLTTFTVWQVKNGQWQLVKILNPVFG